MLVFPSINDPGLVSAFSDGLVGIMPTDTIYGLACRAGDKAAAQRLYKLKHREKKPGTVIAASTSQLIELGLDGKAVRAVAQLWPAPLSIVIPAAPDIDYLDQGLGDLAVRIPANEELLDLLRKTGPLLTSSANHPAEPPASTMDEARKYFNGQVDFYVGGDDLSGHAPSTVARLSAGGHFEILRQGAAAIDKTDLPASPGFDAR